MTVLNAILPEELSLMADHGCDDPFCNDCSNDSAEGCGEDCHCWDDD